MVRSSSGRSFQRRGAVMDRLYGLNRNHHRNLRISRAPLKSQAHQGTSLFVSSVGNAHETQPTLLSM